MFSETWVSSRLTSRSLTMKSSARVTSASARLRTSSISRRDRERMADRSTRCRAGGAASPASARRPAGRRAGRSGSRRGRGRSSATSSASSTPRSVGRPGDEPQRLVRRGRPRSASMRVRGAGIVGDDASDCEPGRDVARRARAICRTRWFQPRRRVASGATGVGLADDDRARRRPGRASRRRAGSCRRPRRSAISRSSAPMTVVHRRVEVRRRRPRSTSPMSVESSKASSASPKVRPTSAGCSLK